jgi:hypothetical protein
VDDPDAAQKIAESGKDDDLVEGLEVARLRVLLGPGEALLRGLDGAAQGVQELVEEEQEHHDDPSIVRVAKLFVARHANDTADAVLLLERALVHEGVVALDGAVWVG